MQGFSDKASARAAARQLRTGWTDGQRRALGIGMAGQLTGWPLWQQARAVFAFCGGAREPDTGPILELALAAGKALYLPRVTGPGRMEAVRVDRLEQLVPGAYGILEPPAGSPASAPAGSTAAGGPPGGALLPARSGHFRWRAFGVDSPSSPPPFPAGHGQRRRESREVPHPYQRPILRTPASASLQSGRAQSRFAPRIPPPASLARCLLRRSIPVPRRLSEAPGSCARIRRKRKAPPPSETEGGGVSVCGFFIARACRGSLFPR